MRPASRHRLPTALLAFAAAAATATGAVTTAASAATTDPATRLVPFGSCEELISYAKRHAPRPLPSPRFGEPVPLPAPSVTAAPEADSTGGDAAEPDFSQTNVQEAGVDEPDIVKTDGNRIFAIAGDRLHEVDARAAAPRVVASTALAGQGQHQLLLWQGKGFVISQVYGTSTGPTVESPPTASRPSADSAPRPAAAPRPATPPRPAPEARSAMSIAPMPTATVLTELDLRQPGRIQVVRTLRVEGDYRAARLVDGVVRLVTASTPPALTQPEAQVAADDWLPSYRVANRRTGRKATHAVAGCGDIRHTPEYSGLGLLTILTIDLDKGIAPVDSEGILSDVGTVYAAPESLYVATPASLPDPQAAAGDPDTSSSSPVQSTTLVHKFSATGRAVTRYRATGSVPGGLLSQWSLSEHGGVLRAASTQEATFGPDGVTTRPSESFVTTLEERDGRLMQLGSVGGLGRDERIYAVRFIGDVGYVVTFRQVDPLYTLDLADPRRPAVLGELKIPGYSAYLHPVGEDLLLGVGQDATDEGRRLGGQVSLFDVSDLRRPQRLATMRLPGWSSEVEWDHHAFLYWPRTRLAVVPADGFGADGDRSGATAFRITRGDGLRRVGELRHPASEQYGDAVRRSIVIGSRLFTISGDGLLSSDLATLTGERWLPFPAS